MSVGLEHCREVLDDQYADLGELCGILPDYYPTESPNALFLWRKNKEVEKNRGVVGRDSLKIP